MDPNPGAGGVAIGPVLFAYDGSELSRRAVAEAGRQLAVSRQALVVCVWQPADVGFVPIDGRHLDADDAQQVQRAAEETAAHGAALADEAGFRSRSLAVEAAPIWKGIVEAAEDSEASLIVIGSHRHRGLVGHLVGSVAAAVVSHSSCAVFLVHHQP